MDSNSSNFNSQNGLGNFHPTNEKGGIKVGTPEELIKNLEDVGYQCLYSLATHLSLILHTPYDRVRALLLEGPSGCGKSFLAKSLATVTGAELMCLSCYAGMSLQNLIEYPSSLAVVSSMAGKEVSNEDLLRLGLISRAFLTSQTKPVILLIDELDKPSGDIDTFFLGPIQDSKIWLESRPPIQAVVDNLLIIFTKNYNRKLDEALLRRVHPITMTYLDSALEKKVLSPHCHPTLVSNLVFIADLMRNATGSYRFDRPPAPEELLTAGQYTLRLLELGITDFSFVGKMLWNILAKAEHDRAVLEHMMRFHPDFMDPLIADARDCSIDEIYSRFGRVILKGLVHDPEAEIRAARQRELDEEYS